MHPFRSAPNRAFTVMATGTRPDFNAVWRALRPWLIALLFGAIGTVSVGYPVAGIGFVAVSLIVWVVRRTVLQPIWGLFAVLWIFPWYQIFRGLIWVYYPQIPLLASRFWLEILLFLIALGVVFRHLVRKERAQLNSHDLPVLFLLLSTLYGLFITVYDVSYFSAVFGLYYSITPILCYFAVRWIQPTLLDIYRLFSCLLLTFTLLALASFYDYFFHPVLIIRIYQTMRHAFFQGDTAHVLAQLATSYLRMISLLLDEDFWGAICALVSLLCMARIATGETGRKSKSVWFALLLSVAGLTLSMSRGAVAGWAVGVVTLAIVHAGRRIRVMMIVFGLCIVACSAYLQVQSDARVVRIQQRIEETSPTQKGIDPARAQQWKDAGISFNRFPSGIGVGASGYAAMYTSIGQPIVTDGFYYHIAVEQGIPGLVLWALGLPGIVIVLLIRLRVTYDPLLRSLGAGLIAGVVSLAVHGIAANIFDYYYVPALFFILLALFMAGTDREMHASQQRSTQLLLSNQRGTT